MTRKLVSVQMIKELIPLANADNLEVATVLAWKCVVKKGEFTLGDKCVFCEIDSVLPDKPEYEFLRKTKFRIRTIRLRGQISQGLCLPLNYIPNIGESEMFDEGEDLTERMGVIQYIPQVPACISGEVKGSFPAFLAKTDETRVQILQPILDKYAGTICAVTEKIDGASTTYYYRNGEFGVCSRNLELRESEGNAFWKFAREIDLENKMKVLGKNIALQGELVGVGIQSNPLKLVTREVYFFNAFDIDKFQYLNHLEFKECIKKMGLKTVPILKEDFCLINDVNKLVEIATGKSELNPKIWREGIVIRPLTEMFDFQMSQGFGNGRVSFKVINPEYLIAYEQ